MLNHSLRVALLAVAGMAGGPKALADVLVLADGSRLVGTIEQWSEGKVRLKTDFAGTLEIMAAKVAALQVGEAVNVELQSGDRLVGSIQLNDAGNRSTISSEVGAVDLPLEKIKNVWPVGADSPEVVAIKKKLDETILSYKPKWALTLEGGAIYKDGNTDELEGRGRLELNRKTPEDLLTFYASAEYSESDKVRTTNEYRAGSRYENEITDRWFWYMRSELEHDEFENLDLRATVAGGLGYYWIKKPERELKTAFGPGYRHESFEDGSTQDDAIADVSLRYRHDVSKWMQFTHDGVWTPSLERFDDYRLQFDTALIFPLKLEQWRLKLGMRNEYDSQPEPGIDRLDNTYYANVLVELK